MKKKDLCRNNNISKKIEKVQKKGDKFIKVSEND